MKRSKTFTGTALAALCIGITLSGCQKMTEPKLAADYPVDSNPVGGPLKFYVAMDGTPVDSIRANSGNGTNATYVDGGISGKAYQGSATSNVIYGAANDFSGVTSFTLSFWMKSPEPAAGIGAQFLFSLPTTTDIWHKSEMFLLMEDGGQSNGGLAAMKILVQDQWTEFVGANRIPGLLDNNWHHLAFVYDETTSQITTYKDGTAIAVPDGFGILKKDGNPRGALTFKNVSKFIIGGPSATALGATPDSWMVNYQGQLDQFRMYGEAMSAAEITTLYQSKL